MKCPKCKSELVLKGQARLETLEEHMFNQEPSLKDKYVCPAEDCVCNTTKYPVCWNEDGETYGGYTLFTTDEPTSAYNSFGRKADIEIHRLGLKKRIKLPAWLTLWFFKLVIEFKYKGNEAGEVLSRSWIIDFWKSDTRWRPFKSEEEFEILGLWWVRTWKYLWSNYKRNGFKKSLSRDFPFRSFEWFLKNILRRPIE